MIDERIVTAFFKAVDNFKPLSMVSSNHEGSNYQIVAYDPMIFINFVELLEGYYMYAPVNFTFAVSVPIDVINGIQGKLLGTISQKGYLALSTGGYSVLLNEGMMTFDSYDDALVAVTSNRVETAI